MPAGSSVTNLQLVAPPELPPESAAVAEKPAEKRRPETAKWPFLLALQHFEQHLVQRRQVIDRQRVDCSLTAVVEDFAYAAPRRFPQSGNAVP